MRIGVPPENRKTHCSDRHNDDRAHAKTGSATAGTWGPRLKPRMGLPNFGHPGRLLSKCAFRSKDRKDSAAFCAPYGFSKVGGVGVVDLATKRTCNVDIAARTPK